MVEQGEEDAFNLTSLQAIAARPSDVVVAPELTESSYSIRSCSKNRVYGDEERSVKRAERRREEMVRGYKQEHVYKHPWDRVTAATWRKYQDLDSKPLLSHVLSVDTIGRRLDASAGRLESTRLVTVNAPVPWWLQRILGDRVCHCIERSTVDASNRTMEMVTRNVTLKDFVEVEERSWAAPHPDNPDWTLYRTEMNIKCSTLSALASLAEKIEQKCIDKFQQNSAKGRQVMDQLCSFLEKESSSFSSG